MNIPSSNDIEAVLAAASSPTHPGGPVARVAVAALTAAIDALKDFPEETPESDVDDDETIISSEMILEEEEDSEDDFSLEEDSHIDYLSDERVLKPLIDGGYLTSTDLGTFLLCTSYHLTQSAVACYKGESKCLTTTNSPIWKQPILWKLLCEAHWGPKKARKLLRQSQLGPEICYRNFALPIEQDALQDQILPLAFQPKDYLLVVEIRDSITNKMLCHECVPGNLIAEFFRTGNGTVPLKCNRLVTVASYSHSEIREMLPEMPVHCNWTTDTVIEDDDWEFIVYQNMEFRYNVKFQIVRLCDQQIMDLFHDTRVDHDIIWRDIVHDSNRSRRVRLDFVFPSDYIPEYPVTNSRMTNLLNSSELGMGRATFRTDVVPDFQLIINNPNHWRDVDTNCDFVIAGLRFRTMIFDPVEGDIIDSFVETPSLQFAHFLEASEAWRDL